MKEGLVTLPKNLVILREVEKNGKITLEGLPLSEIPEEEADRINGTINFIEENYQCLGINYHKYRIVRRGSSFETEVG